MMCSPNKPISYRLVPILRGHTHEKGCSGTNGAIAWMSARRARLNACVCAALLAAVATTPACRRTALSGDDVAHVALRRVLDRFGIPESSQVLVHSKTSLHRDRISETSPRAIYFNDRAAVGWVPGVPLTEVALIETAPLRASFLVADAVSDEDTLRSDMQCVRCHSLPDTGGLQGLLMRSTGPTCDEPVACIDQTDDRTPFVQRWNGWFVTGSRLPPVHGGRDQLPHFNNRYLQPGSDVVALLVLGHQVGVTNLILRLAREVRLAEEDAAASRSGVDELVSELVDSMLFVGEAPFPGPIAGSSGFAEWFEAQGIHDAHGHSLRALDLRHRLFQVPCSYMIQSAAFAALPPSARSAVYTRLSAILSGADPSPVYARITPEDRQAIVHILRETQRDFPADMVDLRVSRDVMPGPSR